MSKVEGNRKKTGGRKKGTPNKLSKAAREAFVATLEGQVPNIEKAFAEVLKKSPEKYLDIFAKYAQYFVPKKSEQDIKAEVSGSFDFNEAIERLKNND